MLNSTTIHVLKYGRIHPSLYGLRGKEQSRSCPLIFHGSDDPTINTSVINVDLFPHNSREYFILIYQLCAIFVCGSGSGNWILRHPWLELDLIWFHDVGCKRRLPPSLETRTFRRRAVRPVEHLLVHHLLHLIFYHVFPQTARIDEHSFASATIEL